MVALYLQFLSSGVEIRYTTNTFPPPPLGGYAINFGSKLHFVKGTSFFIPFKNGANIQDMTGLSV